MAEEASATKSHKLVGGGMSDLDALFAEKPFLSEKEKTWLRKFFSRNEATVKALRDKVRTNEIQLKLKENTIQTGGETVKESLSLQLTFEPLSWKKTRSKSKKGLKG